MLTRKIIDYKITTNSPEKFVSFGNLYPIRGSFLKFFYDNGGNQYSTVGDFLNKTINMNSSDILYYSEYFRTKRLRKTLSTYITNIIDNEGLDNYGSYYSINLVQNFNISRNTFNILGDKWTKTIDVINSEYDAIAPYSMEISDTDNEKHGGETKNSSNSIDTVTRSNNRKRQSTDNDSESNTSETTNDTTTNSVYGFNSNVPVPSDVSDYKSTTVDNNKRENTYNSTETNTDNDSASRTRSSIVTHGRTVENIRNIIRKGNIGNVSYQDLIKQEIDLRKYIILDMISDDLDRVFTRSKYIIGE